MSGIHCINTWWEMAGGVPVKVHPFIDRTLVKASSVPAPKDPNIEYQPPSRLLKRQIAKGYYKNNGGSNGHRNGESNGHSNDHTNGHGNGESNGFDMVREGQSPWQ
jgi:hypothetical protein